MQLKIDLHIHTIYSYDGLIKPKELVWQLKRKGLNGVALTDHDTVKAWPLFNKVLKRHGFIAIPGVEVSARKAHILALNVKSNIPAGCGIEETIEVIHDAGGLAVAAHPTSLYKGSTKLLSKFEAIEVINASSFPFHFSTFFNKKLAAGLGLPQTAGSDAHHYREVGSAYTLIKVDDLSLEDVVKALKRGLTSPCGGAVPLTVRLRREALSKKRVLS